MTSHYINITSKLRLQNMTKNILSKKLNEYWKLGDSFKAKYSERNNSKPYKLDRVVFFSQKKLKCLLYIAMMFLYMTDIHYIYTYLFHVSSRQLTSSSHLYSTLFYLSINCLCYGWHCKWDDRNNTIFFSFLACNSFGHSRHNYQEYLESINWYTLYFHCVCLRPGHSFLTGFVLVISGFRELTLDRRAYQKWLLLYILSVNMVYVVLFNRPFTHIRFHSKII